MMKVIIQRELAKKEETEISDYRNQIMIKQTLEGVNYVPQYVFTIGEARIMAETIKVLIEKMQNENP